jgi:hypothetical protein
VMGRGQSFAFRSSPRTRAERHTILHIVHT